MFSLFKEEPRKVCFTYDLFLNLEGNPPVNHLRCEKLTFNNPTVEFRYKLLMAGGVSVPLHVPGHGPSAGRSWCQGRPGLSSVWSGTRDPEGQGARVVPSSFG